APGSRATHGSVNSASPDGGTVVMRCGTDGDAGYGGSGRCCAGLGGGTAAAAVAGTIVTQGVRADNRCDGGSASG
ncbi:hypothetical protein ACWDE9_33240, partial [Streptomyces olivaceoviridis]